MIWAPEKTRESRPLMRQPEVVMSSELKQWLLEVLLLVLAVVALASAPARGAVLVSLN